MKLVCINCPRGCNLDVHEINGEIKVSGNSCPRGEQYAINEMTNPLRTLTSTVKVISEKYDRLPVITSSPIPKGKLIDAVKELKNIEIKVPVKMGDVVVSNILGLNIDVIASKTIEK